MLHLLLECNVVSMSGVSTSVSYTLGYLLLFHLILEYPILRPLLGYLLPRFTLTKLFNGAGLKHFGA